jgi:hypothetical protein
MPSLDYWFKLIPYVVLAGGVPLWVLFTLQKRSQARRRRLTTVAARFGLFLNWIATAVAVVLAGLGAAMFYEAHTPIDKDTWLLGGGLCVVALLVWLLGRGIYFVLAGSPPEEPTTAPLRDT